MTFNEGYFTLEFHNRDLQLDQHSPKPVAIMTAFKLTEIPKWFPLQQNNQGLLRWLRIKLLLNLVTQVQCLKPTWCNSRTNNLKLFSDLRNHAMAHEQVCVHNTHTLSKYKKNTQATDSPAFFSLLQALHSVHNT